MSVVGFEKKWSEINKFLSHFNRESLATNMYPGTDLQYSTSEIIRCQEDRSYGLCHHP